MNLRDQFLKSGLITQKQANKLAAEKRKLEHAAKKDPVLSQTLTLEKRQQNEAVAEEFERQKQIDLELNRQRDQILEQRNRIYRARQIINSNTRNDRAAQELYFFAEQNCVRKIFVTAWQREMLARGALGIVKPDETRDEFVVIPRETAKILLDICPEKVIVLHSLIESSQEFIIDTER